MPRIRRVLPTRHLALDRYAVCPPERVRSEWCAALLATCGAMAQAHLDGFPARLDPDASAVAGRCSHHLGKAKKLSFLIPDCMQDDRTGYHFF